MKSIKKSIFVLLGVFVLCMFMQTTFAQQKTESKQPTKTLKKGDKIRTTGGKRTVLDRKNKPAQRPAVNQKKPLQRPAVRPNNNKVKPAQRPGVRPNENKPQARPIPGNRANVKRPTPNNNKLRPAQQGSRPAGQKTATEGRLRGIKKGVAVGNKRAMSARNQQAMKSGHSKLKAMRAKLNAAKQKVAKEKAANPNSADVKAKEARIRQAETKIKAMEQEMAKQRGNISRIAEQ